MNEQEDLRGTEIRHLVALVAIARDRSFRTAARRVGCAQSVLSRRLAELESALGARLVERAPGRGSVGLTEAGRVMLAHATLVLARVDAARADLRALAAPSPLRVGVYEAIATRVMPDLLAGTDDLAISLSEEGDDELPAQVARAEVDLAFATLPLPAGPLASVSLLEEPYVLLVPAASELAERTPSLAELSMLPLLPPASAGTAERVAAQLAARGAQPRFAQRPGSDASLRALVGAGIGVAIIPALSVDPEDRATRATDLGGLLAPRTLALVWHRFRRERPDAVRFRDAAIRVCAAMRLTTSGPGRAG